MLKSNNLLKKSDLSDIDNKNIPTDFTHIILSHGGENLNKEKAQMPVNSFLEK
tara:strand:- start:437 stop:595 length:159 start_codon:yes stop_codon:yes gene_type:complete